MKIQKPLLTIAGWGLLALAAQTSKAITYDLEAGNPGLTGTTGPWGSVTVTLGTDASQSGAWITFQSDNNGTYQYLFGDGSSVGLSVNGSFNYLSGSLTASGQPQVTPGAPSYTVATAGTPIQVDGIGNYNFVLDNFDGFNHAVTTISFFLAGSWSSDTGVLALNNDNSLAEGHIFVADESGNNANYTGYAGTDVNPDGSRFQVPSAADGGTTVMTLGSALTGLAFIGRKFRKH